jgi:hypothetical protein
MNATFIDPKSSEYPGGLERVFGEQGFPTLSAIGNRDFLSCRPVALFCSIRCPGDVILRTYDVIRNIRDVGIPMIGGFHSLMEKQCLTFLLRGTQPVIVCPARVRNLEISGNLRRPSFVRVRNLTEISEEISDALVL